MKDKTMFSEKLQELMKEKGLTAKELGKISGVGKTTIYNYVNKKTTPTIQNIVKISKILGVDPTYFEK